MVLTGDIPEIDCLGGDSVKQLCKRSAAWLLSLALLVSLFAGVPGAVINHVHAAEEITEPAAEATNLLADYNASFEDYEIPNWTFEKGVSQSRDKATDGNAWSLKINLKDAAATSDAVAVRGSWPYDASVEVLGAGKLSIIFYDAEDNVVGEMSAVSETSVEWQTLAIEDAISPKSAVSAVVKVSSVTDDVVYFDNASIKASAYNATADIINADFETGDLTGWKGGTVVQLSDGNYANQVATSPSSMQNVWSNRFAVVGGMEYVLTMDIQAPTDTYVQFYAYSYEANDKEYTNANILAAYSRLTYTETAEGEWDELAARITLPANANYVCIRVLLKSNNGENGTVCWTTQS